MVGLGTAVGGLLLALTPPARAAPVQLQISNFRFCKQAPCLPSDAAYVRTSTGPVASSDNPPAVIDVQPGDVVTWTYKDTTGCDQFSGCSGHEVRLEPGTGAGDAKGFAPARSGEAKITFEIPASATAGTVLRYFCNINNHWQFGMTGLLRVKAAAPSPSPTAAPSPTASPAPTPRVLGVQIRRTLPATGPAAAATGLVGWSLAGLALAVAAAARSRPRRERPCGARGGAGRRRDP